MWTQTYLRNLVAYSIQRNICILTKDITNLHSYYAFFKVVRFCIRRFTISLPDMSRHYVNLKIVTHIIFFREQRHLLLTTFYVITAGSVAAFRYHGCTSSSLPLLSISSLRELKLLSTYTLRRDRISLIINLF